LSSNASHDNYNILRPSGPAPTKILEGNMHNHNVYFYCSIGLFVVFLALLTILILLGRRYYLTVRRSKSTGPAQSNDEECPLSVVSR